MLFAMHKVFQAGAERARSYPFNKDMQVMQSVLQAQADEALNQAIRLADEEHEALRQLKRR